MVPHQKATGTMSVKLMGDILQGVDLPTNRKFVLLKFADHADHDGRNAYPSLGRIAHECRLSKRLVRIVVAELVKEKILVIEANESGGRGKPRTYRIDVEQAKELHPLAPYRGDRKTFSVALSDHKKGEIGSPFSSEKGESHDTKEESESTKRGKQDSAKPSKGTVKENRPRGGASSSDQLPLIGDQPGDTSNQHRSGSDPPRRRKQLPEGWEPDVNTLTACKEGFDDEAIGRELARFSDHAREKDRVSRDWNAAFRNWLRKAQDFDAERGRSVKGNGREADGIIAAGARVAARRAD